MSDTYESKRDAAADDDFNNNWDVHAKDADDHFKAFKAGADWARAVESDSPAEQAMQQSCPVCGTSWTADEFLKCPKCQDKQVYTCLNCGEQLCNSKALNEVIELKAIARAEVMDQKERLNG